MNFQSLAMSACIVLTLIFTSCQKDDKGSSFQLYMTDAPFDNAQVEAVFVTVADVKVDGESMPGFTPKTFELSAYQKGEVYLLGDADLDAGNHQSITLVMDYANDAQGNSPGCYLEEMDGSIHMLSSTSSEITLPANFATTNSGTAKMIVDFDLRKCIQPQSGSSDKYDFVAKADLQNRIRVVKESECGTISGILTNQITDSDKVIVYAYEKGTYNALFEAQTQNSIGFLNAVSSTTVAANGTFTLAHLEQGEYECVFVAVKDQNNDGTMEIQGHLTLTLAGGLNLQAIQVNANSTTSLSATVTGILPF
ncbi:MAG: DUF4382 domain-containing protein [Saprospiraceae bacterium]|nr:DUF4382 domain-containing protein [Saprospiraceae bacterium]